MASAETDPIAHCSYGMAVAMGDWVGAGNWWWYCYPTNDTDMESEPGTVMGPLDDGAFHSDFDSLSTSSGISYSQAADWGPYHRKVCVYRGKNYTGGKVAELQTSSGDTADYFGAVNEPGSFYWTTPNTACAS